ncbi:MAG: CapA family protein, partial [Rubrobacter sp.]
MTPSITFIGDTLLGGDAKQTLDREGYAHAFNGLAPLLSDTDLVANHEGPITLADHRSDKGYNQGKKRRWYRAHSESVHALAEAGIGVVSLANNHVLDFGPQGLADTIGSLEAAGISHCGAALNVRDAYQPAVVTVGGCRVAFLSYMQNYDIYTRDDVYASPEHGGVALLPTDRIGEELDSLGDADLRVVLVHWGRTYKPVTSLLRELAVRLRGAGADLVIGHHSHTAHGVDLSERCPVLFS